MLNFFSFYWDGIIKQWSIFLLTVPGWPIAIKKINDFWFKSTSVDSLVTDVISLIEWWWVLIILLVLHIRLVYKMHQEGYAKNASTPADNLPDEYVELMLAVERVYPDVMTDIAECFSAGNRSLQTSSLSLPLAITNHWKIHRAINSSIQESVRNRDARIIMTKELNEIMLTHSNNFNKLHAYNMALGNNLPKPSEHELREVVLNANNSALSMFTMLRTI